MSTVIASGPDPAILRALRAIPGVGERISHDLWRLGIRSIRDLRERDPEELYARLCTLEGRNIDRCMLYVFRCAVYFASVADPDPELLKWWHWKDTPSAERNTGKSRRARWKPRVVSQGQSGDTGFELVERGAFHVVGIETRPRGAGGRSARDVARLWERFYVEDLPGQIPRRADDRILGLYVDYAGADHRTYTLVAGCAVTDLEEVPDGMVARSVPAARYAVFPAEGTQPDALLETWSRIEGQDLSRTFEADFEVYDGQAPHPPRAQVDVYVAID